ncbi:MAG: S8 family serine peptidase, partial [archaeon]
MKTKLILGILVAFMLIFPYVIAEELVPYEDFVPGIIIMQVEEDFSEDIEITEDFLKSKDENIQAVTYLFGDPKQLNNIAKELEMDTFLIVKVDENSNHQKIIEKLTKQKQIKGAYLDWIYKAFETPNDSNFSEQWEHNNTGQSGGIPGIDIESPHAWEIEPGREDVVIAILDSGINLDHEDLMNKLWINEAELNGEPNVDDDLNCQGWPTYPPWIPNFGDACVDDINGIDLIGIYGAITSGCVGDCSIPDNDPSDAFGHGTAVSGPAGAETNNGKGIASLCQNCKIMPIRVMYDNGVNGYVSMMTATYGVYYATDNGANVISMSFGIPDGTCGLAQTVFNTVLTYAQQQGVIVVAAAGNYGNDIPVYPACRPEVISVASHNPDGSKSSFSNYGNWVDV